MIISSREMEACRSGQIGNPHQWLGMHLLGEGSGLVVRVWDPGALKITILESGKTKRFEMEMVHSSGFFELHLPGRRKLFKYTLFSLYAEGGREWADPYSFLPYFCNQDLLGFNEGWDRRPYEKLGAIPIEHQGHAGVSFVVWAPSAKSVHLVGDFNHWNPVSLPMRSLGNSGCRELFVPFAKSGDKYKFRILGADDKLREKTDPFGWRFEPPMGNASIIQTRKPCRDSRTRDGDQSNPRIAPLSIYEMHLGSWRFKHGDDRPLSYLELAEQLPVYLKEMGFSHVEFLPPSEYPYGASWGVPSHRLLCSHLSLW